MIVVDASALLEVLLQTEAADEVAVRLFGGDTLHAPHVLDLEVAQVLRRYERAGELSARRGAEALDDLAGFRIERYPHHLFLERVWSLRANATAYDACYLALAEALDAPLLTRDRRLARSPGHSAHVELVDRLHEDLMPFRGVAPGLAAATLTDARAFPGRPRGPADEPRIRCGASPA